MGPLELLLGSLVGAGGAAGGAAGAEYVGGLQGAGLPVNDMFGGAAGQGAGMASQNYMQGLQNAGMPAGDQLNNIDPPMGSPGEAVPPPQPPGQGDQGFAGGVPYQDMSQKYADGASMGELAALANQGIQRGERRQIDQGFQNPYIQKLLQGGM